MAVGIDIAVFGRGERAATLKIKAAGFAETRGLEVTTQKTAVLFL
jgi:hypothetical protein